MALNKCPKCGKEICKEDEECSVCGYKIKSESSSMQEEKDVQSETISKSNKKWKTITIVSACIIVAVLFILWAMNGFCIQHNWQAATCTEPKICSHCGKTEGEPLGHNWQDATCTEPKTCERCEKEEGKPLGHDWRNATCLYPKNCKRCDATEGEALGHTAGEWTTLEEPTLSKEGKAELKCSICGAVMESKDISKKEIAVEGDHFTVSYIELRSFLSQEMNKYELVSCSTSIPSIIANSVKKNGQLTDNKINFSENDSHQVTFIEVSGSDVADLLGCVLYALNKDIDIYDVLHQLNSTELVELSDFGITVRGSGTTADVMTTEYWNN